MHQLVAIARQEAAEGRGAYIAPAIPCDITHKQFQRIVVEALVANGWRCYYQPDSRLCPSGFPDIFAAGAMGGGMMVEIKIGPDRLSPWQKLWRDDLHRSIPWFELRPENWDRFLSLIDDGHIRRGREMTGEVQQYQHASEGSGDILSHAGIEVA